MLTLFSDCLGSYDERREILLSITECVLEMRLIFPEPVKNVDMHSIVSELHFVRYMFI